MKAVLSVIDPFSEARDIVVIHQTRRIDPEPSNVLLLYCAGERLLVAFEGAPKAKDLVLTREWVDGFLAGLSAKRVSPQEEAAWRDNPTGVAAHQSPGGQAVSQELRHGASNSPVGGVVA